ncbi:MAG: DMT family transporter [Flavobacteriales bacterium]|nr:DMT family transporter [Flavobacteriales bacterium]
MNRSSVLPHLALLAVNCIYGANYVVAKGLMPDIIGPSGFILLRVIGAVLVFWIFLSMSWEKVERKDLLRIAVAAIFGVALNQLLFFNGLNHTSPINSAIIMTTNPIMVLVMASLILGERITKRRALGVALGFIGATTLILLTGRSGVGGASIKGDVMIFINSLSFGVYLVMVKPLMLKYRPLTVISWVFLFGLLYVIPFGWVQFSEVEWSTLSSTSIWSMVYVVLAVTVLAYGLNLYALSKVSPNVVSSYIYLQPVLAGLFGLLFFYLGTYGMDKPVFTWPMLGATLMIFTGVWMVSKRGR